MDDVTAKILIALLGGGGGVTLVLALINGITKWLSGAAGRERRRNASLAEQRAKAIEERELAVDELDEEIRKRRAAEALAAGYYRQLIMNGVTPGEWPLDQTIPKDQLPPPIK